MSVSDLTLSLEQGLAIFAALAGAAFLLLGRRSTSRGVLATITSFVALAAVLAGVQLIHLKPTHALLSDSESTAPQSVVAPTDAPTDGPTDGLRDGTGSVSGSEQNDLRSNAPDDDDVDSTKGDAPGQTGPSSPADSPSATPTQPDPTPLQQSPGTDADPAPTG